MQQEKRKKAKGGMTNVIPEEVKKLWDEWNLRGSVLFSLFLQILLIFCAPTRKRKGNTFVTLIIWSAYLLADWVAAFAVGLIANSQNNMRNKCETPVQTEDLLALWAPFLLLHLGGPDAITAFSLEDNELWIRHLFGLLIQLIAVGYVIVQALPSELWIPTSLMLLAGIIKYAERTRALYLGCLGNFEASMLPPADAGPEATNYAQLMEAYTSKKILHVPAYIKVQTEFRASADYDVRAKLLSDLDVVEGGFKYFNIFKGLIVDLMFTFQECKDSRRYFFARNTEDAFKVLEVELNFMYDAFYTKMVVVNGNIGYFLRFICSTCLVASLERFAAHHKQKNGGHLPNQAKMHPFDVYVTYALLIGAICLDSIAVIKLIFSDWTIVLLRYSRAKEFLLKTRKRLTVYRIGSWSKTFGRRWSNSMSQHSLVRYCLKERFKWIDVTVDWFGLKDILDEIQYKDHIDVPDDLKNFICKELKEKAKKAEHSKTTREICSGRGDWVLSQSACQSLIWSVDGEYDESLLLWHIATDLCFYEMPSSTHTDPEVGRQSSKEISFDNERKFSKFLSDYMLYLLVMRPTMMSAVAGIGQIRFRDTCEEAKKFFRRKDIISGGKFKESSLLSWFKSFMPWSWLEKFSSKTKEKLMREKIEEACAALLLIETVVKPIEVKGDRSKSVLFDACILAKELKKLNERKRWKVISEVWVELLSYAASQCGANTHVQQLSKGGELVTFVWLLMTQLGLGDQFRVETGHARPKMLVQK
ncbi:hypothetical protein PVL29_025470 [Vitis rotundifolia]|uniref:DUF4220 domain-containing protein n=1 Tax=Vitis rotundifolia TaxID=103349 RepID=A0AA38YJU7_VITRO|nr:hypothetical protein PVL29_025470 [Vitis rotundifolia]